MTQKEVILDPFLTQNRSYLRQKSCPKSDPKWVISGSLARARARARGDKIDFVLEMPFWGLKTDYPKMTNFGSFFGPQNHTSALRNRPKK